MRARFNSKANDEILNSEKYIDTKEKLQEILNENIDKEICLEIGMGKGKFISEMAMQNQDKLFIGIEVCIPVLALGIKKIKRFEEENTTTLNNLYLMSIDASKLEEYFLREQVSKIYLNFSDPWPKKRHTKRRLTYKDFLEHYKFILNKNGIIEFKTDNRLLFEYSLVSMQNFGMTFLAVYLDLHKTDIFNVETEYENKFSASGPIYKLVAKF